MTNENKDTTDNNDSIKNSAHPDETLPTDAVQPEVVEVEFDQTVPDETATINEAPAVLPTPDPLIELEDRVKELEAELTEIKNRYLRTLAEMDNMRKRADKEKVELLKYGNENLLKDILPTLDSFDKALVTLGQESGEKKDTLSYLEGVTLVYKQLLAVLDKHGLKPIEALHQTFNPNLHQGLQRIEIEGIKEEVVTEEYSKGYTLNDRLLRPSMVVVSVPK